MYARLYSYSRVRKREHVIALGSHQGVLSVCVRSTYPAVGKLNGSNLHVKKPPYIYKTNVSLIAKSCYPDIRGHQTTWRRWFRNHFFSCVIGHTASRSDHWSNIPRLKAYLCLKVGKGMIHCGIFSPFCSKYFQIQDISTMEDLYGNYVLKYSHASTQAHFWTWGSDPFFSCFGASLLWQLWYHTALLPVCRM